MLQFWWGRRNKQSKNKLQSYNGKKQHRWWMQRAPPPLWNDLWCLREPAHTPSKHALPTPHTTPVTHQCCFPFLTCYPVRPGSGHRACSSDSWPGLVLSTPQQHWGQLLSEELMNDKWRDSSDSYSSVHHFCLLMDKSRRHFGAYRSLRRTQL